MWQAEFIAARLRELDASIDVKLLGMTTKGDRWLNSPLSEVGGKGLFVKELELAIAAGDADLAVHSCKDLPAQLPSGFELIATGYRADVRDVLVSPRFGRVDGLPEGARVGTSSLRRAAQLLARRPDLRCLPVRGNVGTRLAKLDAGDYDALILAAAGLERLGLGDRVGEYLAVDLSLPAAGQGALSVECASSASPAIKTTLQALNEPAVAACVLAERGVSAGLGADCSMPLAAHATLATAPAGQPATGSTEIPADRGLALAALVASADGTRIIRAQATGTFAAPQALGAVVAEQLLSQGAAELLAANPSP